MIVDEAVTDHQSSLSSVIKATELAKVSWSEIWYPEIDSDFHFLTQ